MLVDTSYVDALVDLLGSPVLLLSHPHDEVEVEVLEEDFVEEACLLAGVRVVLLTNRFHVEATNASKACDGAAGPVLSLVAVYHDGVIGAINDETQSALHLAGVDTYFTLVGADMHAKVLNTGFVHEAFVLIGNGFRYQGQDALDFEVLDELVISGFGVAAAIDASGYDGTVVQGWDAHVEALGYHGSDG